VLLFFASRIAIVLFSTVLWWIKGAQSHKYKDEREWGLMAPTAPEVSRVWNEGRRSLKRGLTNVA